MASSAAPLATRTCSTIVHTLIIVSISLLLCTDTTSPAVQFHNALTSTILDEIFTNFISQFIDFTKNLGDLRNCFLYRVLKRYQIIDFNFFADGGNKYVLPPRKSELYWQCRCSDVTMCTLLTYVRWFARSVCTNVIDIDSTAHSLPCDIDMKTVINNDLIAWW